MELQKVIELQADIELLAVTEIQAVTELHAVVRLHAVTELQAVRNCRHEVHNCRQLHTSGSYRREEIKYCGSYSRGKLDTV